MKRWMLVIAFWLSFAGTVEAQQNIRVTSSVLPTGASTESTLSSVNSRLPAALGAGGGIKIDGSGTPIPISGSITATNPSVGTGGAATPTSSTTMGGTDGTNLRPVKVFDADSGGGTEYILGVNLRTSGNGGSSEIIFASDAANQTTVASNPVPMGCVNYTSGNALTNAQVGFLACDTASRPYVVGAGVAGTPAGGVLSIQGVASMTHVLTDATQSGTWTVQPGNTANTTPWLFNTPDMAGPIATGQISVTTSATQMVAARTGRVRLIVTNLTGTDDVFCSGTNAVTVLNGDFTLLGTKGASNPIYTSGAVWCRVGTTSQTVTFREEF